jgi:hypothetical protein
LGTSYDKGGFARGCDYTLTLAESKTGTENVSIPRRFTRNTM